EAWAGKPSARLALFVFSPLRSTWPFAARLGWRFGDTRRKFRRAPRLAPRISLRSIRDTPMREVPGFRFAQSGLQVFVGTCGVPARCGWRAWEASSAADT